MPEPTVLEQPQAVAEASFGEKTRPTGPLTHEDEMRWRAVESIRKQRAAEVSEQTIAESMVSHPPPTEGRVRQVNNENFGTERVGGTGADAGDKKYNSGERSGIYRKEADKIAGLSREMLSDGYDGLKSDGVWTADQKREFLRNELLEAAKSWPLGKGVLEAYGPYGDTRADAARAALMEEMLKNPNFAKKLSSHFSELYDGEGAILSSDLVSAEKEFKIAEAAYETKKKEFEEVDKQFVKVDRRYWELQPGGREFAQMNLLKTESTYWPKITSDATAESSRLEREINTLTSDLYEQSTEIVRDSNKQEVGRKTVKSVKQEVQDKINNKQTRIDELRRIVSQVQEKQTALNAYLQESSQTETKREELREKSVKIEGELAAADIEKQDKGEKLNSAKANRQVDEEIFVNSVQGMVREAGRRFFREEIGRNEQAQVKAVEKATQEAKDKDEKAVKEGMKSWRKGVMKNGRMVYQIDKDKTRALYGRIMTDTSAEGIVKVLMESNLREIERKFGNASPQYVEEFNRLQEKYKDKEFMKQTSSSVAERVFKDYVAGGNKLRKEDVSMLLDTDWGVAAIDAALANNGKVSEKIDELRLKSAFSGSKREFMASLVKNPKTYGIGLGILALIFAAPFMAIGLGAAASAYSAAGAAAGAPIIG